MKAFQAKTLSLCLFGVGVVHSCDLISIYGLVAVNIIWNVTINSTQWAMLALGRISYDEYHSNMRYHEISYNGEHDFLRINMV